MSRFEKRSTATPKFQKCSTCGTNSVQQRTNKCVSLKCLTEKEDN